MIFGIAGEPAIIGQGVREYTLHSQDADSAASIGLLVPPTYANESLRQRLKPGAMIVLLVAETAINCGIVTPPGPQPDPVPEPRA